MLKAVNATASAIMPWVTTLNQLINGTSGSMFNIWASR